MLREAADMAVDIKWALVQAHRLIAHKSAWIFGDIRRADAIDLVARTCIDLEKRLEDAEAALKPCAELIKAMETCHICKTQLCVDETPTHCESCSYDCEDHEEPDCKPLDVLHGAAKKAIDAAQARAQGPK
jgi:hypothetical protein